MDVVDLPLLKGGACCKCSVDSLVDRLFIISCPLTRGAAYAVRVVRELVVSVGRTPPIRRRAPIPWQHV